ncbi:hypothetical protein ACFE04_007125 [Oxalis oulophora]
MESDDDDDFRTLVEEQLWELESSEMFHLDLELAYHLQLQEALSASLASPPPEPQSDTVSLSVDHDLIRRTHDLKLATDISTNYEASTSSGIRNSLIDEVFRVYFKGLVCEERAINGDMVMLAGIGVAICDPVGSLVLEVKKPLIGHGINKIAAELKALIEGLNAALSMDLKRLTGKWSPKQKKVLRLMKQIVVLQGKFTHCHPILIARNNVKHAFMFAREAIESQINKPAESSNGGKTVNETCAVCLEDTDTSLMFAVDVCLHRYCFSCMRQHVQVKLLHGLLPKCPYEGCNSEINIESSRKFLTPKLFEMLTQHLKEASIPVTEKVYCPYPRCSALMSNSEISEYAKNAFGNPRSGARKCLKCHGLFCLICKVPWHSNMTCDEYKKLNPNPPAEDVRLKTLATRNLWKQCLKCKYMIELSEGCYHITCRCGHEFCYNCGAGWKNKKATCNCPLFDEDYIWYNGRDEEDDDDEDDDNDLDDFYESDSESDF